MNMGDAGLFVDILRAYFGENGGRMHTIAEVGTHRGETSAKILRAFPGIVLWMVDSYRGCKQPADESSEPPRLTEQQLYIASGDGIAKLTGAQQHQNYLAAVAATEFAASRRTFCKFPSVAAAKIVSTPKLSAVLLDAAHYYEAVRDDSAAWWPKVEARGLMAWHDYSHPRNGRGFGVKQAVDEFAEKHGLALEFMGSIAYAVKP